MVKLNPDRDMADWKRRLAEIRGIIREAFVRGMSSNGLADLERSFAHEIRTLEQQLKRATPKHPKTEPVALPGVDTRPQRDGNASHGRSWR